MASSQRAKLSSRLFRSRIAIRGLAQDRPREAARRLGTLAVVLSLTFLLGVPIRLAAVARGVIPEQSASLANAWAAGMAVVSVGVFALSRREKLDVPRFLAAGLVYEVALCLAVCLLEQQLADMTVRPPRMSYMTPVLVAFPIVVPTTTARRVATTMTAAATPMAATQIIRVFGDPVPPFGELAPHYIMMAMVGGVAIMASRIVHQLARDADQARQLGSYQLEERLGAGGMGEVWRARHHLLARPAAIKLIKRELLDGDGQAEARFEREAQATSALRSPHTVQLYDFGVTEDGTLYYAMELLDGVDLDTAVRHYGPMNAARTAHILKQIAGSLEEAHRAGLVHRDIKPANVFVCRLGEEVDFVKVLDFGLVKPQAGSAHDDTQLSRDFTATGTPAFMPPELALGEKDIDGRADLYSVGCLGYWLLTGSFVFDTDTAMKMLVAHAKEVPARPSSRTEIPVPQDLDDLILSCLHKDPAERPATARALIDRLAEIAATEAWTEREANEWWDAHIPRARA